MKLLRCLAVLFYTSSSAKMLNTTGVCRHSLLQPCAQCTSASVKYDTYIPMILFALTYRVLLRPLYRNMLVHPAGHGKVCSVAKDTVQVLPSLCSCILSYVAPQKSNVRLSAHYSAP